MVDVSPGLLTNDEHDALLPLIRGNHESHWISHAEPVPGEQRFLCSCNERFTLAEGVLAESVDHLKARRARWNQEHLVPSSWMAL